MGVTSCDDINTLTLLHYLEELDTMKCSLMEQDTNHTTEVDQLTTNETVIAFVESAAYARQEWLLPSNSLYDQYPFEVRDI